MVIAVQQPNQHVEQDINRMDSYTRKNHNDAGLLEVYLFPAFKMVYHHAVTLSVVRKCLGFSSRTKIIQKLKKTGN